MSGNFNMSTKNHNSDKIIFQPNPTSNAAFYFNIIETIMLPYVTYVGMPYIKQYKDIALLKHISFIGILIVLILASQIFPILNKSLSLYITNNSFNTTICSFIILNILASILCKNIV
jgi:hypothetical protein